MPQWQRNHITFGSRGSKTAADTRAAWETRRTDPAGWTMEGRGVATGTYWIALGQRAHSPDSGYRGGSDGEMVD